MYQIMFRFGPKNVYDSIGSFSLMMPRTGRSQLGSFLFAQGFPRPIAVETPAQRRIVVNVLLFGLGEPTYSAAL